MRCEGEYWTDSIRLLEKDGGMTLLYAQCVLGKYDCKCQFSQDYGTDRDRDREV